MKIGRLRVDFSPRRRQVGKNPTRLPGKEIFRRFRISNQIFGSVYGSRDIERSLDPTLVVFSQNRNFMDEYLENGGSSWPAVFCKCSVTILSIILEHLTEIVRAVFEKIAKKYDFDHIFVLYGWTGFFAENPAVSHFIIYQCLTSCKVSRKSLEPFTVTFEDGRTN